MDRIAFRHIVTMRNKTGLQCLQKSIVAIGEFLKPQQHNSQEGLGALGGL
jgi:hypothetical protein